MKFPFCQKTKKGKKHKRNKQDLFKSNSNLNTESKVYQKTVVSGSYTESFRIALKSVLFVDLRFRNNINIKNYDRHWDRNDQRRDCQG